MPLDYRAYYAAHEDHRWSYMNYDQLLRRLGNITIPEKLMAFITKAATACQDGTLLVGTTSAWLLLEAAERRARVLNLRQAADLATAYISRINVVYNRQRAILDPTAENQTPVSSTAPPPQPPSPDAQPPCRLLVDGVRYIKFPREDD